MKPQHVRRCGAILVVATFLSLVGCGGSSTGSSADPVPVPPVADAAGPSDTADSGRAMESLGSGDCSGSSATAEAVGLEDKFWQRWCESSISERLEEGGLLLSPGETWRSFAVTVGVNMCNDIGALIAGGSSAGDAQLEIENKFSAAILGDSYDIDRMVLVKGATLSAASAAVDVLCPENAEVIEDLKVGSGEGCSSGGLAYDSQCPGVDLAGADLSDRDLSSVNLSSANLDGVDFSGSDLTYADLSGASVVGAKFDRVRWWSGVATGANFRGSTFDGAYLSETKFVEADFSDTNLVGANFEGADLRGSRLSGALGFSRDSGEIRKAFFMNAHLGDADLTGAVLPGVNFKGAQLTGAVLDSADIREAYFECADLTDVAAIGADATGATYNGSTTGYILDGMTRRGDSERCDPRPSFPALGAESGASGSASTVRGDEQEQGGDSAAAAAYVEALGSWSSAGFEQMMELSSPNSPAWSYGYHLRIGRRSEMQAGRGDGNPLRIVEDGGIYKICFTSSCSVEVSDFSVEGGLVGNFFVNGRSLADSISAHPDDTAFVCGEKGFCAALRSSFWFGGTVYSAVEVTANEPGISRIRKVSVSLEMPNGSTVKMTSGTTPNASGAENAYYSLGFATAEAPWGGYVVVKLRSELGTEVLRLPV